LEEIEVEKEVDRASTGPHAGGESAGASDEIAESPDGPDSTEAPQQINEITSFIDASNVYGSAEGPAATEPDEALETPDGSGEEPQAIELENVQITSYQLGVLDNDAATDDMSMTLNFEEAKVEEGTDAPDDLSADDDAATVFAKSRGNVEYGWKVEEAETASEEEPALTSDSDDAEGGGGTGVGRVGGKMHLEDVTLGIMSDKGDGEVDELAAVEPDDGGSSESGDAGEQTYLAVELENLQDDSEPGAADEMVAGSSEPQAGLPKMLEVFQKGEAKDAVNNDEPSTLVSPEDGGTGEMVKMGGDAELDLTEMADEPDLDELEEV
jgi:hypothetical protein